MIALRAWGMLGLLLVGGLAPLQSHAAADLQNPDEVIRRAEERFRQLTDCECMADTDSRAGKKTASGTYHLWFKKPDMVRIRVVQGGHRGSEVTVDRDGKIRGREGGLLRPFVVGLSKSDRRLQSIRGVSITQLDWGSFYRGYHEAAAHAGAHTAVARPLPSGPYEVTVTYADGGKRVREVYRVDPVRWTLAEADIFEDDTRVDHIQFRDINLDTGLADSWFRL